MILGNLIRRKGMKKFVLLAVIAALACGGLYGVHYLRIITNTDDVYGVYKNNVYQANTVPTSATPNYVQFSAPDATGLYGTWRLDPPADPAWYWEPTSFVINAASAFFPITGQPGDFLNVKSFNLQPVDYTPVELSSFTATLNALNDIQINWVTQSESNMQGYRVYRNENLDNIDAVLITPIMVPATNTSQQQSYTVVDNEVEVGGTYYYWLESVEFNQSSYYGPVSITVQGEVPPVYPEVTTLKNAYPNPFRANTSTNINVEVKDGETGTVTIYNLQGKVVKAYNVTPGSHTITWNGTDSNGNACSSGIYLYKLSTPSANATKKMVIIK